MPERQFITPLPGVKVIDLFEGTANIVIRGLVERSKELQCPRCKGVQLRIKTRVRRKLKHGMWNNRLVWLVFGFRSIYAEPVNPDMKI